MKDFALVAAAALGAAVPVQAAEIQIPSQGPVIELTVTETAKARPDLASVNAGVTTRALQADVAARQNAEKIDAIITRLRALGIARDDIQTSTFSINPQYQYRNEGQSPVFLGYDVTNQVNVKLRRMDRIGTTLDALISAGANNVNGPSFMLENDTAAREEARKSAFTNALARARSLAGMAGYRDVRLLEVSETYASRTMYKGEMDAITVSASRVTPIEPGVVGTSATLTVKYEMTR